MVILIVDYNSLKYTIHLFLVWKFFLLQYAGSSWDELKHARQAVGFLVCFVTMNCPAPSFMISGYYDVESFLMFGFIYFYFLIFGMASNEPT